MNEFDYFTRTDNLETRLGAGGVVVRVETNEVLVALIKEVEVGDAHYVLPKGGIEPNEDIDMAARREIHEEAGLTELTWLMDIGEYGRVSYDRKKWQTSHYALYITRQAQSEILDKENHYGFGWFPIDTLPPMFWDDERRIILDHRSRIEELARAHATKS